VQSVSRRTYSAGVPHNDLHTCVYDYLHRNNGLYKYQDKTAEPSSSIDKRNAPRTSKRDTGTITSASKAQHSIHPPSLRRSLSLIAYTKSQLTTQARHERGEYDRPSITENWYTTKKAVSQRNWGPKCKSIFTRASLNVYESEM